MLVDIVNHKWEILLKITKERAIDQNFLFDKKKIRKSARLKNIRYLNHPRKLC